MSPKQSGKHREQLKSRVELLLASDTFTVRPDLEKKQRARVAKSRRIVAYDLETTPIAADQTPRPVWLTVFSADWSMETAIRGMAHLRDALFTRLLTDDNLGASFVAWNGNRFDAYIIAACLLDSPELVIIPYLTRTKALRGMRIVRAEDANNPRAKGWEFLDGISMLGLAGVSLAKFLDTFAPEFPKLAGTINFESGERFDPDNPTHRAYAMRDSEGLYHGMTRAQSILMDTFGEPLQPTMGSACIRIFQSQIPADVTVNALESDLLQIMRSFGMRGGFCYCVRRYRGPVWKYDINQAYASAMREAALPCGAPLHTGADPGAGCYLVRITATRADPSAPFYYRTSAGGRLVTRFDGEHIADTWITDIEHRQLLAEGWSVSVLDSHSWPASFNMREYVDRLERLRMTCDGGPSGPIGTMVKAVGNHSYGKTVEDLEPLQFILAAKCPADALPWFDEGDEVAHLFYRLDEGRRPKAYHQPHLGAWITAHVRMVLRRAILLDLDAWLYADTDCVIFSRDVTAGLDIDPKRYGAWKIEESGTRYEIIGKKVYREVGPEGFDGLSGPENPKAKRSAKAMRVRELTAADFARWFEGAPPVQTQTQSRNFLHTMAGAEMFRSHTRRGSVPTLER